MATNSVNFGGGNVTGYFYSAPANTPLPAYPLGDLHVQCAAGATFDAAATYYTESGGVYTVATPNKATFEADPTDYYTLPWVQRGYISEDGITWSNIRNNEPLKDWARKIVRTKPGEDPQTIQAPIISTDETSLEALFGADAITVTAANSSHGKVITVDTSKTPASAAFLFVGRDGDDSFMLGTTEGFINTLDDVTFTATDAITWTATIAAAEKFIFAKDDGQTVVTP